MKLEDKIEEQLKKGFEVREFLKKLGLTKGKVYWLHHWRKE